MAWSTIVRSNAAIRAFRSWSTPTNSATASSSPRKAAPRDAPCPACIRLRPSMPGARPKLSTPAPPQMLHRNPSFNSPAPRERDESMSPFVWLAFGVAAIVVIAIVLWAASRRSNEQLSAVRQEMQNSLALHGQSVAGQINHLMQAVTTQLGQVRQELQSGVASSGKLASDAQIAMAQQLQASSETIRKMSAQLGEVQQAGRDMSPDP